MQTSPEYTPHFPQDFVRVQKLVDFFTEVLFDLLMLSSHLGKVSQLQRVVKIKTKKEFLSLTIV